MIKKLDKKSIQYLGIIIIIAIIICVGFFYYLKKTELKEVSEQEPTEKTIEEVIKSLTAPEGEVKPVPEDVIKSLTAPEGEVKPVPEDVIKSLTAPE